MATWIRVMGFWALAFLLAGCEVDQPRSSVKKPDQTRKTEKPARAKSAGSSVKGPQNKPPTHKVDKGLFKIDVTLKGTFVPVKKTEVVLRPEVWGRSTGSFTVLKAVPHGTHVHKGETLVWFDVEKIDRAIKELQDDHQLAELALRQAEEELPVLEKLLPLDLASSERAKKMADEDLKRFVDKDRALLEKTAHFEVKSAKEYLDYAKEELRQLEKMYRSKDMTEETEEIILKRQRDTVERMAFFLQTAEASSDLILHVVLPRRDQNLHDSAIRETLALEKVKYTLPLTLSKTRLGLAKLKYDFNKAAEQLAKLQKDRAAMPIKAPADGIVYYGKFRRGQWSMAPGMETKFQRGGVLMAEEVILTIVKSRPLIVRAEVEEKEVHAVRPGVAGKAVTVAYPDLKLAAKVEHVSAVPIAPGQFEAKIAVTVGPGDAPIMPGMACTIKLVPYQKTDALTVPRSAVFSEELDEDNHYVYVWTRAGKPEKRPVVLGKKTASKTEILKGLQEGEEVLLQKPEPAKKAG